MGTSIKLPSGSGSAPTVVANYSALPDPTTVGGKFFWCSASQGTSWLPGSLGGTYYNSGLYYSNGTTWEFLNVPFQATQSEVDAGTVEDKFVTPKTFNDSSQLASKVPYTGANSDVDLGNNDLNAKGIKIKGTGGAGHLNMKHQSSNPTAGGSETVLFAGSDGELRYKNDGNAVEQFASRQWVNLQGFITNVISALGFTPENVANKGASNGYAPLNSSTKIDLQYLPDAVLGQVLYGGVVNVSTASATLTNNAKTKLGTALSSITLTNNTAAVTGYVANEGIYYITTVAGTFAGLTFEIGDWLISIGSAWAKVDNTDAISSFNTRTGAITLLSSDVTGALGYTPGTITSVTGTSPILSSGGTTPAISIATANTSTTGALTSTDWNTFNNKRNNTVSTIGAVAAFTTSQIYNTIASPATGNITDNLSGAIIGIVQKIYHNDSVAPTFPAGWVRLGSGTYTTSSLNIIYAEWVSGTRVEYWIVKGN